MFGATGVLAHQGGWDELLLVAAPIVIFVVLLKVANARAGHLHAAETDGDQTEPVAGTEAASTDGTTPGPGDPARDR